MISNQFTLARNKSLVRLTNDESKEITNQEKANTLIKGKKPISSAASTTSSSSSSSSSSWLAQSFRKAFGKTDHTVKKKMKSKQSNAKIMSSLSINNCSTVLNNNNLTNDYNEIKSDRNSCGTNSKRSSLSDDENNQTVNKGGRLIATNGNKLSLLPSSFNDTDSEFEDELDKSSLFKHKNLSLSKRSYRSESELVTKFQIQQQIQQNRQQINNQNDECDTFNSSKKLTTLNEMHLNMKANNLIRNGSKLSKTHKSVNSLLVGQQTNENQFYKLQEINQSFYNQPQSNDRNGFSTNSPQSLSKAISMQKFNKWY